MVKFIPGRTGTAVFDRSFNTASMLAMYMPNVDLTGRITWNQNDPNVLRLSMPG